MPARRIACIVGQSNEVGSGVFRDRVPSYGCPTADPVGPNGSSLRSMWPYLAELMGRRNVWLTVYNSAVGSTSLAHSWNGYIRTWASSMLVCVGSYALSGGKTWKVTAASTTFNSSTVTPAAGLQADGVTWSDLGSSTATDTVGLCSTDNPRFDPNGYIATAYAGLSAAVGYDEKWCFVSIGQSDKTMSVVAADYAQAMQNVTNYMLTRSVKVALGMTCYGNTSGLVSWMDAQLIPGRATALAAFSGNGNVKAGANLASSLGVLPTSPAYGLPGLQSDDLHMNDVAYALASEAWRDALVTAGW